MGEANRAQGKEDPVNASTSPTAQAKKRQRALILEKLRETPVIEVACKKAGTPRATFYRWLKRDAKFKEQVEEALWEGRRLVNDMCESQLMALIREKRFNAIAFWLHHNDPRYKSNNMKIANSEPVDSTKSAQIIATENVLRLLMQGDKDITKWFMQNYMSEIYGATPREIELMKELEAMKRMKITIEDRLTPNAIRILKEQRLKSEVGLGEKPGADDKTQNENPA